MPAWSASSTQMPIEVKLTTPPEIAQPVDVPSTVMATGNVEVAVAVGV